MLRQQFGLDLKYLGHGQQAKILQVLISILDKQPELGDTELHGGGVVGEAQDHCADTLIEQGHGCGAVDEIGKGLHQLLGQPRLQWGQCTKLKGREKNEADIASSHSQDSIPTLGPFFLLFIPSPFFPLFSFPFFFLFLYFPSCSLRQFNVQAVITLSHWSL